MRITLQPAFLADGAIRPGVAAEAGEASKDLHHAAAVEQAGGMCFPLAVESFGVWSPHSIETLKRIAARTTSSSGLTANRAIQNLLQQLSVHCGNSMPAWYAVGCRCWTMLLAGIFPASLLA